MHGRAQVPFDVPVAGDRAAPEGDQAHVQDEGCEGKDGGAPEDYADALALQAEERVVECQEGRFGAPQADVDEEERYPGYIEEVCGLVPGYHVVE